MNRATSILFVTTLAAISASGPARAQTISVGYAAIHVTPEELDWASGVELSLQLGPRGAPFEFIGSYRYLERNLESSGRTCDRYWPTYQNCSDEIVRREASMSTWMIGILFEPGRHPRAQVGLGLGLEVNRVAASGHGETTGRDISIYNDDGTLGAVAFFGQGSFTPVVALPVELIVVLKAETTSFGGRASDDAWGLQRVSGVLAWAIGARYVFSR